MTDAEIRKNVEAELSFEPSINASEIGVAVKDGIVTLTGRVDSYWEKIAAEEAAARVAGVKAVANELEIRLPFSSERTDEDIARAAVNRLEWTITVPKDRIKVKVSKGWVTLEGEVDWQFQKNAAAEAVRNLVGIKGVINHIVVKERPSTAEVKAKIDRHDPFVLLEGMTIAAVCAGATQGYIYLRSEYPYALRTLNEAIGEAYQRGYLGKTRPLMMRPFHKLRSF